LLGKLLASVEVAQENISFNTSMKPMVEELQALLTSHLQGLSDNLVHCAVSHCNNALSGDSAGSEQLRKAIEAQTLFPVSVVQAAVMENASLLLVDKFNELSAAMCRAVCERVLKEVVQALTNIYKSLVIFLSSFDISWKNI